MAFTSVFLSGTAIAVMGTVVAVGAAVYEAGAIDVKVQEKSSNGTHIHLIAPAAIVPAALPFVPNKVFRKCGPEARLWIPAAKIAVEELQRYPDFSMVEVEDGNDHVVIKKQGNKIVIDVNSDEDIVHVSVPLHSLMSVMKRIEAAQPDA